MSRRLIGFQFANAAGVNIAGDPEDPTKQPSYAVITPSHAAAWAGRAPGFLLMPIFDGEIEEPAWIGHPDGWKAPLKPRPAVTPKD